MNYIVHTCSDLLWPKFKLHIHEVPGEVLFLFETLQSPQKYHLGAVCFQFLLSRWGLPSFHGIVNIQNCSSSEKSKFQHQLYIPMTTRHNPFDEEDLVMR